MYYDPHSNTQLRAERTDRTGRYIPLCGTKQYKQFTSADIFVGIVAACIIVAYAMYGIF